MTVVDIVDSCETIDATAAYELAVVRLDLAIAGQESDKVCHELFLLASTCKRAMLKAQIADVETAKAAYLASAFEQGPPQ